MGNAQNPAQNTSSTTSVPHEYRSGYRHPVGPVGPRGGTGTDGPVLITLQAASHLLGVPATTLRDWVFRNVLPVVKVPGCRRWWLKRADVLALVERHKEYLG